MCRVVGVGRDRLVRVRSAGGVLAPTFHPLAWSRAAPPADDFEEVTLTALSSQSRLRCCAAG